MSGTEGEEEESFEGISWERELEDDALAEAQTRLEKEFGITFEETNYGQKGFSREKSLPFYTEIKDTVSFMDVEVEIGIERDGEANTVNFWTDDLEAMERLDQYLNNFSNGDGEVEIHPYEYRRVRDTRVKDFILEINRNFNMDGPMRRPGNGSPEMYPVRMPSSDYGDEENVTAIVGNVPEYVAMPGFIPGDARFELTLEEGTDDAPDDLEAFIDIKPRKTATGLYDILIGSEDPASQLYVVDTASGALEQ